MVARVSRATAPARRGVERGMSSLAEHYRAMAGYNRWMNGRLYLCCMMLDDSQRKRDLGAHFGSLHDTLCHLLWADRAWMLRFTGDGEKYRFRDSSGEPFEPEPYGRGLFEDFTVLMRERKRTDRDILDWASTLEAGMLEQVIRYRTVAGQAFEHPLWWAVSHFFNHQTHHRGQATALLMQLGQAPGITDLIALLREQPPG
jgi:uncharacterized damage-inducible protein DinB